MCVCSYRATCYILFCIQVFDETELYVWDGVEFYVRNYFAEVNSLLAVPFPLVSIFLGFCSQGLVLTVTEGGDINMR